MFTPTLSADLTRIQTKLTMLADISGASKVELAGIQHILADLKGCIEQAQMLELVYWESPPLDNEQLQPIEGPAVVRTPLVRNPLEVERGQR